MNKLGAVLVILVVVVVGPGFYRGWFVVSSGHDSASNKVDVNLTLDRDKVKQDAGKVKSKVRELTQPAKN